MGTQGNKQAMFAACERSRAHATRLSRRITKLRKGTKKFTLPSVDSTLLELAMSFWPGRLLRTPPLGPRAIGHIRLQRVRGLDRVLRGPSDDSYSLTIKLPPPHHTSPLPVSGGPYMPMTRPIRHLGGFKLALGLYYTTLPIHHAVIVIVFHAE